MTQIQLWNWLDWLLALIVVLSLLSGASEGFVRGMIGLASLVVGLAVAAAGYQGLGNALGSWIHSQNAAYGVAFLLLFILVLIVGAVISGFAARMVKAAGIRWLDRLLGLAFGLVRGLIGCAIAIMVMVAFSWAPDAVKNSQLRPITMGSVRTMVAMMPADLRTHFEAGLEAVERQLIKTEKQVRGDNESRTK
ncbi:MAG TPA: CvpA family protein [Terriglobia bacterium]|jgi:membrane protein required for colicin V production|nr:CvpA family protein [Terriglobia bacterium]